MLNFTEDKFYNIEEYRLYPDEEITVKYTKDLRFKKVNNDPWRLTSSEDIKWFYKYYKDKF